MKILNKRHRYTYLIGIMWYTLSLMVSNLNDVFTKHLGSNMHAMQVTFLRFLFATIVLIPFMIYFGKKSFSTSRPGVHIMRGALLYGGIALWVYGLSIVPITVATVINFTIPIFVLILAIFFLSERVGWQRWIATIAGFAGVILVLQPSEGNFNPMTLLLLLSALMFAALDVTNKKFVVKETMLSMLFYSALVTMLLGLIPAINVWQAPTTQQWLLFFGLGCGGNLLLFFLLKAFAAVDASALSPFRYFELVIAGITGYLFFQEVPAFMTLLGAVVIIPSTLFIVYYETKRERESQQQEGKPEATAQEAPVPVE
ncbi:MAG: EamA family transporter [Verrucomicrobia bacterium CG_4_9_14_3_um_filter_43_20]|nr:MAG: EamA family transporter [Verrucomicrobia bacterium CG1_02_43_26]PIP59121.1 MAG: EamA family transporter [Verrucomicrobia bacterium CG22_combo_CG10-13_8_21_14_all_43_17]PIY61262.1 MAG: EamA family transporter [Verrucomicrobia bacterium CG_4_10_14_0_8_um_filter_43_34]PJA43409.1 MAG: EamA family transporter [Verrucomicrobia bacterium CG_4_9_14_3_um_filter_43_20]